MSARSRGGESRSQIISSSFDNENIFKNEANNYRLNKHLDFENKDEEVRFVCDVSLPFTKALFFIFAIISVSKVCHSISLVSFLSGLIWMVVILLAMFVLKNYKDKLPKNQIPDFYSKMRHLTALIMLYFWNQESQFCQYSFSASMLAVVLFNMLFLANLPMSVGMICLNSAYTMFIIGDSETNFLFRFLKNLITMNFASIISFTFAFIVIQYYLTRALKQTWALYDSFKYSYHNLIGIYDEINSPIIIISKKKANITSKRTNNRQMMFPLLYKNSRADAVLFNNNEKKSRAGKSVDYLDIFDDEVNNIFSLHIDQCLNYKKSQFTFPIKLVDSIKYKENKPVNLDNPDKSQAKQSYFMYEGKAYYCEWFTVTVASCNWKSQDAIYLQFVHNNEFNLEDFSIEYFYKINSQLLKLNQNIDLILNAIPKLEEQQDDQTNQTSLKEIYTKNFLDQLNKDKSKEKNMSRLNQLIGLSPRHQNSNSRITDATKGVFSQYPELSVLYLISYNASIIKNMFLTLTILKSGRLNRKLDMNQVFNLKTILTNIYFTLYPLARIKNLKIDIEYNPNTLTTNILSNIKYFNVIFFNIINYMITNVSQSDKKSKGSIKISVDSEETKDYVTYKFLIHLTSSNLEISFKDLKELLSKPNPFLYDHKNITKFEMIDIGIFIAFFVLKRIFLEEVTVNTDNISNHEIIFNIKSEKSTAPHKFNSNKQMYDEIFYDRVLEKLYQIKPLLSENKNSNLINVRNILKDLNKPIKSIDQLIYFNTEEIDNLENVYNEITSLKKDQGNYSKVNILSLKNTEIVGSNTRLNDAISFLKSLSSFQASITSKLICSGTNVQLLDEGGKLHESKAKWSNDAIRSNVRFYEVPLFLIVEDNPNGRTSLIKLLRENIKTKFKIELAALGIESVKKFKNYLNRGYRFDLILMDINLPDMLGIEASQIMRDYESNTNIHTIITAVTMEPLSQSDSKIFDGYFEKPIKDINKFTQYIYRLFRENRNLKIE